MVSPSNVISKIPSSPGRRATSVSQRSTFVRSSCVTHAARRSQRQRGQYVISTRGTQERGSALRLDLPRRAVGHGAPELLDLLIGERDATVRPVVRDLILARLAVL